MNKFHNFKKKKLLDELSQSVKYCSICSRFMNRVKILSDLNGNVDSKVLFIAEAPGRLGADRTHIPLYGDKSGRNFENLLTNIGWRRDDIFITNAVLCNPREENGNNSTPTINEIQNCKYYLEMTLNLIDPEVIVTLGQTALAALSFIKPHQYMLKEYAAKSVPWFNKILMPLYHPGPRAQLHRSIAKQRSDFMRLQKLVDPIKGLKEHQISRKTKQGCLFNSLEPSIMQNIVIAIIDKLGEINYFKLTKLLYLIDLTALEKMGHTLTESIYLRQEDGPWSPDLKKEITQLIGREIDFISSRGISFIRPGPSPRFSINLDYNMLGIITEVVHKYGDLSNAEIKSIVYLTKPLKYLLLEEKKGRDMRKVPLIYKNKTAIDLDVSKM